MREASPTGSLLVRFVHAGAFRGAAMRLGMTVAADSRASRRYWVLVGLIGYVLVVGIVLLSPVGYSDIVSMVGDWLAVGFGATWFGTGWIEFGANVLMFVPLGFLLTLLFRHHWYGIALALALSVLAEMVQFVIPMREPSLRDVLANTAGAAAGVGLAWVFFVRRDLKKAARDVD